MRHQKSDGLDGFLVTWDVDSTDPALCGRLRRFIFGYVSEKSGRRYTYPGLLDQPGVRYLGQSVVFVPAEVLPLLRSRLDADGIDHAVLHASIGALLPS